MELTAINILKRHNKYPDASPLLIDNLAFEQYKFAVKHFLSQSKIQKNEASNEVIITIPEEIFNDWKDFQFSDFVIRHTIKEEV